MSAAAALTLVWLGAGAPDAKPASDLLGAWGAAHGVVPQSPARGAGGLEALEADAESL